MNKLSPMFLLITSVAYAVTQESTPTLWNQSIQISYGSQHSETLGKTHFILGFPSDNYQKLKHEPPRVKNKKKSYAAPRVLFPPRDNIKHVLLNLIEKQTNSLYIAIYSFTDKAIADALIAAKKRGVDVQIVTDLTCIRHRYSKIDYIAKAGIPIYVYNPRAIRRGNISGAMHNKFIVFHADNVQHGCVWTGSCNLTKAGRKSNQENIIILYNTDLVEQYAEQFAYLKSLSYVFSQEENPKGTVYKTFSLVS